MSAQNITLAWDPNPEPNIAGYTVYVGINPGTYGQTFDVPGGATSFTFTQAVPGTRYYFSVAAYNTQNVTGPRTGEVSWKINVGPSLTQPPNTSTAVGSAVSMQLQATDDGDPLTFTATGLPAGLSLNQSTGLITGTPTTEGVRNVSVTVSDGSLSASRSFTWTIGPQLSLTSFTVNPASPRIAGTAITLSASASGGTAPYQYRFQTTVGSTTTTIRDWNTNASYTWTPTLAANYTLTVGVRSAGSTSSVPEATASAAYVITNPPLSVTSLTPLPASPQMIYSAITVTAVALGGLPPYQYKFLVTSGSTTTTIRNWANAATTDWMPTQGGNYTVTVWVRNAGQTADVAEAQASVNYVVTEPPPPPTGTLVSDTFMGLASTLAQHSPEFNTTGGQWTISGSTPAPTVSGGVARVGVGGGHVQATIATGESNVIVGVDYRSGNGPHLGALAFRLTDGNNHLMLMAYGNALQFYRKQNGQYTLLASQPITPIIPGITRRLEVRTAGTTLEGWYNGSRLLQISEAFNQNATRHGLDWNSSYDAGATYDNFSISRPAPPPPPATPNSPSPANASDDVSTGASLAWTSAGATNYDVRFGTSNPPAAAASNITASTFAPATLAAGTTYYWQIVARNAGGTTTGPVWSFTTATPPPPPPPPGTPTNPNPANGSTPTSLTSLTWTSAGATSYDVRFGTSNPPPVAATGRTTASHTVSGLQPSTTYYWQIVARNTGGSTTGPVWSFETPDAPDLLVSDTFTGSGTLAAHAPDINVTGASWSITGASPAPTVNNGFARVGVGSGHVQATLASGVSDFVMTADYRAGNGPHLGALAFRLVDGNNHLLLMAYDNVLYFYRRQGGVYTALASRPIPAVAAGSTHRLEVRATGSTLEGWWDGTRLLHISEAFQQNATRHGLDWNSAYDATATFDDFELRRPAPPAAPTAPTSPSPANGATNVNEAASLGWSATGATSYRVRLGTSNPPAEVAANHATTSYTPADLAADTTYYWQIVAVNAGGSTPGPVWSFTTAAPPAAPGTPSSPSPANGATGVSNAQLAWTASGATSYDVRFGTSNPPAQVASSINTASYTPSGVVPDTRYYWQIVARNAGGTTTGPVWSFETPSVPAGTLVVDTFVGSGALSAHAPDTNTTGAPWTITGASPAPTISGGWARVGNGGGHMQATIASGVADFVMGVDYRSGNGPHIGALAFRLTDANNHLLMMAYDSVLQFYRKQNGTYTLIGSQPIPPITPGITRRLEVRATGGQLEGWYNGTRLLNISEGFNMHATRHGLDWNSGYDAGATYDNFSLTRPAPPAPPAAPNTPTPANNGSNVGTGTALDWEASGATTYDVRFGTSNPPALVVSNLGTSTYTPGGLTSNTTYYWQIVARNSAGTTTGPVWSFQTGSVPAGTLVVDSFTGSGSLASHAPDSNATGSPWTITGMTPAPTIASGWARIAAGTGHVQATIASGTSDFVMGVDYRSGNGPHIGALVFRLTDANNFLLMMAYDNVLQFYRKQHGLYLLIASQSIPSITPGTTRRLEVRASGGQLEGWYNGTRVLNISEGFNMTATRHGLDWNSGYDAGATYDNFELRQAAAAAAPTTPSNPSPGAGGSGVSTSASLDWTSSGAQRYRVHFGTVNPPPEVEPNQTTSSYTPGPLTASTTYYWRVIAVNNTGSTAGPVWSFTTAAPTGNVIVSDSFAGGGNTSLTAHAPDVNGTGSNWTLYGPGALARLSGSGMVGSAPGSGHIQAAIQTGVSNVAIAVDYRVGSSMGMGALVFRLTDTNNHLIMLAYENALQIFRKHNGAYMLLGSQALPPIVSGTTHRMEVRVVGSRIEGWWDGVRMIVTGDDFLHDRTRHGIGWNTAYDPTATYDNFEVRPIP